MFFRTSFFCITLSVLGLLSEGHPFVEHDGRIIGGEPEKEQIGSFPYMVSLQVAKDGNVDRFCGGSIIDKHWILTAASCVNERQINDESNPVRAVGGVVNIMELDSPDNKESLQKIQVTEKYVHPEFDGTNNDIAILYAENPFNFTKYLYAVPLPPVDLNSTQTSVRILGWGLKNHTETGELVRPKYLSVVMADVKPYSECNTTFPHLDDPNLKNLLCVGEYGKTACGGDAGGPLEGDRIRYLYGVASRGSENCDTSAVYTRIFPYTDTFIYPTMEKRLSAKKLSSFERGNLNLKSKVAVMF